MAETFKIFLLRHGQSELNHENIFCGWIDARLTDKGASQARNTAKLISEYCQEQFVPLPQVGYISRLVRTHQTMDVILDEFGVKGDYRIVSGDEDDLLKLELPELVQGSTSVFPIFETWRLNERHYGAWQGQRKPKILQEYGEEQYMYIRRDYHGRPPSANLDLEMVQEVDDKGALTGYEFKEPNRHLKYGPEESKHEALPDAESLSDVCARLEPFLKDVVLRFANERDLGACLIIGHGSSVRAALKLLKGISDEDIKNIDIPNGIPLVIELEKGTFKYVNSYYLDPESAKINAAKVRREGFESNQ